MDAVTVRLSEVVQQEVSWVWPGMLPAGKLTIPCGDPGLGKSFLTLALAARVSTGAAMPLPDGDKEPSTPGEMAAGGTPAPLPEGPGDVVLLSAEDDAADTLKPRLLAMGGDPARVHVLEGLRDPRGAPAEYVLGQHTDSLDALLASLPRPRLMVIDPVSAYVGAADSYNNAHVRAMLKPVSDLAAAHGVAVLLVTHLRKGDASKALYRAMGSLAFTAAARVVLCLVRDEQDAERRLLLPVKSNLGQDRVGYAFRIREGRVEFEGGAIVGTADEVIAGKSSPAASAAVERARAALREVLAKGPVAVRDLPALLEARGVTMRAAQRAEVKEAVGAVSRKAGKDWVWELEKE